MKNYVKCKGCNAIIKEEDDENTEECPYCGLNVGFLQASEREWRTFYTGTMMQPCSYNEIKSSTQTTFI